MDRIWIGPELWSLGNMIRRYFDFATHRKEIEAVTGNNGRIICFLADNADRDVYQKHLEEEFGITRSTASKVLRLMEQKGLITRHAVKRDARLKKIVLTEKAREIYSVMRYDKETMEQKLVRGFSEEEIVTLYAYIQRMKDNISGTE
jgi:MarR family transcriptional regulator for hemolysin